MEKYNDNLTKTMKTARRALYYNRLYGQGQVGRGDVPEDVKKFVQSLPATPFTSGRNMYLASQLRGHGSSVTGMIGDVQKAWARLSETEKKSFEDRAKADINMYKDALRKYLESH